MEKIVDEKSKYHQTRQSFCTAAIFAFALSPYRESTRCA
ncbi:Uncharacterised protein [Vibrio cholerae]|nr:Uncharacterised protein [Vibrio cholerae]